MRSDIEVMLGLMWETSFGDCDQYDVSLMAGYEMMEWFQLNEIPPVIDDGDVEVAYTGAAGTTAVLAENSSLTEGQNHGNIAYQGLTVRLRFDF